MSRDSAMAALTGAPPPAAPAESPGLAAVPTNEPPKDLDSTRFANLARKEAEIVKQREAMKVRETELMTREEKTKAIENKWKEFEDLKAKDQVAAMKMAGFSDTDLVNFLAAHEDNSTPEEKAAKAAQTEIQKFKDEQAAQAKEAKAKENTQVIDRFKKQITEHVTGDKDKYEYINHHGPMAEELILEWVSEVLNDPQQPPSENILQEAADTIEAFYEESDQAMSVLKKRQPKPAPEAEAPKDEPLRAEVSSRQAIGKTLSNKTVATTAGAIPKRETPSQKRERLIEKLRNGG